MWSVIKSVLMKFVVFKLLKRVLGSFGVLLPIALILKAWFGWPALLVVGVLAAPLIMLLAFFGLPIGAAVAAAGGMLSLVFMFISIGFLILKVVLAVVIVGWIMSWLYRGNDGSSKKSETPPPPPPESGERPASA